MRCYNIIFAKEAEKDLNKLTANLKNKLKHILTEVLSVEPYSGKKLVGDLYGFYSFRLTYKDRIVYEIDESNNIIYIHKVRTHYGK